MDKRTNKPDERGLIYRDIPLDASAVDAKSREVHIAFSSEEPVIRYDWETGKDYLEVLDHSGSNADLSRLNNGGAFLVNHNTDDQVGSFKKGSVKVDADKIGRGIVKMSRSARGTEILDDMVDNIRGLVSFGYQTTKLVKTEQKDGMECRTYGFRAFEASTVPIPADTTVGVGRSQEPTESKQNLTTKNMTETPPAPAPALAAPVAAPAVVRSESEIRAQVLKDTSELIAIGRKFNKNDEAQKALTAGMSPADFRKEIMDSLKSAGTDAAPEQIIQARSVGDFVIQSAGYKEFCKKSGQRSISLDIPHGFTRTTGDPATTTGLTSIDKQPGIVLLGQQPPRVADLMTQTPTQNTTIRYISENSLTVAATAVAENGAKPEATWDLVEVDASVKKIAVIGRVTDEFFQDYDATRDYINNRLAYMVAITEDKALLNADGTSNTIKGILQFTGIQTQAQAADTAADAIFKAITKIRSVGFFEPDAIVMNPTDLQNLRLTKDKNGQYYWGGPFAGSYGAPGGAAGSFTLFVWGLPVVWTTSITSGTCLVGAFRMGAQIFRKLGLTIETTNSDASDFQYNRIAIRAETRLTLAVYRPLAFCQVTGLS
jgi:HK97 family phage major capsid protein